MLSNRAFCFVCCMLLIMLQSSMSIKENQQIQLERFSGRLGSLTLALDAIFARVESFERKVVKLLAAFEENNESISALCYEENENILKAVLNDTETIKLKQDIISKYLANFEQSFQNHFNASKSRNSRQTRQLSASQSEALVQNTTTSDNSDLVDILNEVLLKQNNLEAIFQLILEKSEKNNTADFIKKQFDELKDFIISNSKTKTDETKPEKETPLHDQHLNCLRNCDDAVTMIGNRDTAVCCDTCKEEVRLFKIVDSTLPPFYAFCTVDNWMVVQRREDGTQNFFKKWLDYKNGFGDVFGEYWMGLERLQAITNGQRHELLVVLEDYFGRQTFATYSQFRIGTEDKDYALYVSGYEGTADDFLSYHNQMKFSTYDRDNDESRFNCARTYKGGWCYKCCYLSNLNGKYFSYADRATPNGINWGITTHSLRSVYMAIRPYTLRSSTNDKCGTKGHDEISNKYLPPQRYNL